MSTDTISDHVLNGVEPVDVYVEENGERVLDGYALAIAPEWWTSLRRNHAEMTDERIARLQREVDRGQVKVIGPVRATYSSAWADAKDVRYVAGSGFAYVGQER